MSKHIVIVSNYYPPEIGAAANRIKNLAEGLQQKGNKVTVLCPLPNYPEGKIFIDYKGIFRREEEVNNIIIKRFWIFPSKSRNPFIRLFSMLSFSWSLWFSIFSLFKNKPDTFIIQSPPLLVGLSGLVLAKFLGAKRILNVSDLWPLSALELDVIKQGKLYDFLEKIERLNYKLASKIVTQSHETADYIKNIVTKDVMVYRNAPSFNAYNVKKKSDKNLTIVYAGLLGFAQGVLEICQSINFKKLSAEFHIYGAGMHLEQIIEITKQQRGIFYHGVVSSCEIKEKIRSYDVSLVPLKNKIYGAVPSKIFELMQLGVPILFFGEGEGQKLVKENSLGMYCKSNDFKKLEDNIKEFVLLGNKDYKEISSNLLYFHKKYFRLDYQLENFIKFIKE